MRNGGDQLISGALILCPGNDEAIALASQILHRWCELIQPEPQGPLQPFPIELHLEGEAAARGTETVLVLDQAQARYTFVGVATEPVPSLLRGFSAPVVLDDGLSQADLLVLLAHDSDAFNRWEASQRLMMSRLLPAVAAGAEVRLDDDLVKALRGVLTSPQLDAAFKELALSLPSQGQIHEQLATVNPQHVHRAHQSLRQQLAAALRDDWASVYETLQTREGYRPDARQSGQRALANLALSMLVLHAQTSGERLWPGRAYQKVKDAGNMTERMGALTALVHGHAELADAALAHFHSHFRDEALVIDKWFSVQATAPEKDGRVFERVKALAQHPDYSPRNPNRARSLVAAYAMSNPGAFHRNDAAGYVFWAERVVEFDAFNPQMAARLARVMERWRQLAEPWAGAAREALARVAARTELSADVREIVERSLGQG